MRRFSNLPSTDTPINDTNLNGAQTDILDAIGITTDNWSSSATYSSGAIVIDDNCLYENTTGTNTTTRPSSDSTNWSLVPLVVNGMINSKLTKTVYSESETKTNKTWINGKPIYRKVINFGALPDTSTKAVAHNISNLDIIIDYKALAKSTSATLPIPYMASTISYGIYMYFDATNITVETGYNRSAYSMYVVLEYTKTTD